MLASAGRRHGRHWPRRPHSPSPATNWTGFYIGGHIGALGSRRWRQPHPVRHQPRRQLRRHRRHRGRRQCVLARLLRRRGAGPHAGRAAAATTRAAPNSACAPATTGRRAAGFTACSASTPMNDARDAVSAFSTTPAFYTMLRKVWTHCWRCARRVGMAFGDEQRTGWLRHRRLRPRGASTTASPPATPPMRSRSHGSSDADGYQAGLGYERKLAENFSAGPGIPVHQPRRRRVPRARRAGHRAGHQPVPDRQSGGHRFPPQRRRISNSAACA